MKYLLFKINILLLTITINCFGQNEMKHERKGFAISVNSKFDEAVMTKEEFQNAFFGIHSFYPEFVGRVSLKGFTLKYPYQNPIEINGTKLTDEAIHGLMKLNVGDMITVSGAIAEPDGDYRVEVRHPMIITLK